MIHPQPAGWLVAVVLLAFTVAGDAQQIIRGTPGEIAAALIGKQIGEGLAGAITAARKAAQVKAVFNADISSARQRYYSNPGNAAARGRLAELLQEKDLTYAVMYITEGTSDYSVRRVSAFDTVSGGPLDGGIPAKAFAAYMDWIRAIRADLGVANEKDLPIGLLADANARPKLMKAMNQNRSRYDAYTRLRDEEDRRMHGEPAVARAPGTASNTPAGGEALHSQRTHNLSIAQLGKEYLGVIRAASARGESHKVLSCTYGPRTAEGGYTTYDFWSEAAPTNRGEWLAVRADGLKRVSGFRALSRCPSTLSEAKAISAKGVAEMAAR